MPTLHSGHFGSIQYEDDAVFDFPAGLPGFEQERRFLAVEHPASKPIVFLHSLTQPSLCFITLPVLSVKADYRLEISQEDRAALELSGQRPPAIGTEVMCLAIVTVAQSSGPTANLLAPVVVNLKTRRGLQTILPESSYSHQYPVLAGAKQDAVHR